MNKNHLHLALSPTLVVLVMSSRILSADAKDYFDPNLLAINGAPSGVVDLSAFEQPGQIPPGRYMVNVYVNQNDYGQHNIQFSKGERGEVYPELTPEFLDKIGVNLNAISNIAHLPKDKKIGNVQDVIPESRVKFDFPQQRLDISIPQIVMQPKARGYVDPSLWDEGVPAFLMNYTLNGGRNWQSGQHSFSGSEQTNLFANVTGGLNWDAWRLRSDMTYTYNDNNTKGYNNTSQQKTRFNNTYLQRDLQALRSEFLVGESNAGNDIFDSIPFKGIKVNSSEDMLPTSLRGFAPLITGIAQSNARVTVTQNGNVVYQTFVPPGPFRIDDLYQTGQGGDLTVKITEADGSVRTQTVAFSSLPLMQRLGGYKYEVTTGRYNGGITHGSREADFVLATLIYGLPYDITLYGGSLFAKDYNSFVFGSGLSLGVLGALSADITTSKTQFQSQDPSKSGNSYRVRYSKSLLETGTSVDLTAYRYSTKNYYSFADYNNTGYQLNDDQVPWAMGRQRSNFQIHVSQQLGDYGAVYLSGSRNDYWENTQVNNTLSAGYTSRFKGVNYSVAYTIDRIKGDGNWPQNRQLAFNMQVPLSLFSPASLASQSYASYQMTHNNQGQVQQQAGINGTALDNRFSYNVMQGWSNTKNNNNSSTLNLGYQGSQGAVNMGYGYSDQYRSLNMSANGGVVVHPHGVTFSQTLGSAVAIVEAPEAAGTSVMSGNVETNSHGYAIVPYLSNYQRNTISLNPATLPDDVDITQSSLDVYPTKGAVVMAKFATRVGSQALITLSKNGAYLPFGTLVSVDSGSENNTGIVGDAGQVYLSGLSESGHLTAKWGQSQSQQCQAKYSLKGQPAPSSNNPIRSLNVQCETH